MPCSTYMAFLMRHGYEVQNDFKLNRLNKANLLSIRTSVVQNFSRMHSVGVSINYNVSRVRRTIHWYRAHRSFQHWSSSMNKSGLNVLTLLQHSGLVLPDEAVPAVLAAVNSEHNLVVDLIICFESILKHNFNCSIFQKCEIYENRSTMPVPPRVRTVNSDACTLSNPARCSPIHAYTLIRVACRYDYERIYFIIFIRQQNIVAFYDEKIISVWSVEKCSCL